MSMSVLTKSVTSHSHQYTSAEITDVPKSMRRQKQSGLQISANVLPWILGLVCLIGWYLITTPGRINELILPAPSAVFSTLVDGLASGLFWNNAWVTIQESVIGFLLAVVVALPVGYGLAKSRLFAVTFQPYLAAGQAIPAIVIAPLFVLWFGYGMLPNVLICMLVVLFPMVINTAFGVRSIEPALTDAARVEGAAGLAMLSHIEFPLALPAVLAAVRTCFTLSITGALVGEFVGGGDQGLGALVLIAKNQYNTPLLFATLVVLAVLAAIYYSATWLLEKSANAIY
jgi:NitT/TauT family transport system permease protein